MYVLNKKTMLPIMNTSEPHLAIVVIVDTSGSMTGSERKIEEAISEMKKKIEEDEIAGNRAEICLITFNDAVIVESSFGPVSNMEIPHISCGGVTCTHAAIELALHSIAERKRKYIENNIPYYRPWIWLLTDGNSTDKDNGSYNELLKVQRESKCIFFGVAIGNGINITELQKMHKNGMVLRTDDIPDIFQWITQNCIKVSAHNPGEKIDIRVPNTITLESLDEMDSI